MTKRVQGLVALVAYLGTIIAANWAVKHYGIVHVWFGLSAPAAVYFAGLAFTLRDIVHHSLGEYATFVGILIGAAVSYFISPSLAVASATAFLASELADFAVYTPLRRRGWMRAVLLSNAVGLVIDSALFLWLAFGSFAFLAGQIVGKAWMTLLFVGVLYAYQRFRPSHELA